MMQRKDIPDDYSTMLYTRIKRGVCLPVPAFEKAFASALRHDFNPLLCFSLSGEGSDEADDEDGPQPPERPERIIAYLTPRMACKMFWQGLALCKQLEECRLPAIARPYALDANWWDAFRQCLKRIIARIARARSPDPNCNGEVMALYLLLEHTQSAEECGHDADVQAELRNLPSHQLDTDFELLKDLALSDYDLFLLFSEQQRLGQNSRRGSLVELGGRQQQRSRRGSGRSRGGGPGGSSGDLSASATEAASSMCSGSLGDLFGGMGVGPMSAAAGPSTTAVMADDSCGSPLHPTLWFRAFDVERMCDHM